MEGHKWKLAARAAVNTMVGSFGGGMVGLTYSYLAMNRRFDVSTLINCILASLVSNTGKLEMCSFQFFGL